jgi:hypothetical protein
MRAVLDHFTADDELGLVGWGQSNRLPTGDRDTEGLPAAFYLKLQAAGLDLTIESIASATSGAHCVAGTTSTICVADTNFESASDGEWINGEVRLVCHEWGESNMSALRPGHGKVTESHKAASLIGVTFELTNNLVIWPGHNRKHGSIVFFITSGTLPGLTSMQWYYVRDVVPEGFKVCVTPNGPAIDLAGGSGLHVVTGLEFLVVDWLSDVQAPAAFTVTIASPAVVTETAHNRPAGSAVTLTTTGALPTGLSPGGTYYVANPTADTYNLTATLGGALINTSGSQSGVHTATTNLIAFTSGYVHMHDRFKVYDNVQFVVPFMPIAPGDYPAGAPAVPGVTLPADVTSYSDLALVLGHCWDEGVDGFGYAGSCTVAGTTITLTSGGPIAFTNLLKDGFVRVGNSKGIVASNTTTAITVTAWIGGTPANGAYEVHLPHWRNNPHHYTAGDGFLYPPDHSQPSGNGYTYSRPRGVLTGSYTTSALDTARCSLVVNALGYAQIVTGAPGQLAVSIVSGKLRLQRTDTTRDPLSQLIQFEDFARAGYIVRLLNFTGLTANIEGYWRVAAMQHTTASSGSYIDLDPYDSSTVVPGSISGTVPAGVFVQRTIRKPAYLMGALLPTAWRMSTAIGRRIVCVCVAAGSTPQVPMGFHNSSGFQGKLGWYDSALAIDWTPSNPDGLAARLERVCEFIAPRAVQTSLGASKLWKVIAIDGIQGETDSTTVTGRELAQRTVPTFVNWLRSLIEDAGLSPYPTGAKIPFNWPQITHEPWETTFGDTVGKFNAALTRWAAFDGFGSTPDLNDAPKGGDVAHFNGAGQAMVGQIAADALLPIIDFAFQFALGPDAIGVANQALSLIGDAPNVTSLEPPNATTGARLCAQFMAEARDAVLQSHPWTFATRRTAPVAITESAVASWVYTYVLPPDLLYPTAILDPQSTDDVQIRSPIVPDPFFRVPTPPTVYGPASQVGTIETDQEGHRILRTDQLAAVLIYVARNVDFAVWDPLVRQACVYRLAYLLAGATLKGREGAAVAEKFLQLSLAIATQAAASNAEYQRDVRPQARCPWLP